MDVIIYPCKLIVHYSHGNICRNDLALQTYIHSHPLDGQGLEMGKYCSDKYRSECKVAF